MKIITTENVYKPDVILKKINFISESEIIKYYKNNFEYSMKNAHFGYILDLLDMKYLGLRLINYSYAELPDEFKVFNEFIDYLEKNHKLSLLYPKSSKSFVQDYIFMYSIKESLVNKKNYLLFNTAVNQSEALLYYNTIINNFRENTYYIENMYEINSGLLENYQIYFDKLIKYYSGEQIYITNKNINYFDSVVDLINKYNNLRIDCVFFDFRRFRKEAGKFYEKPLLRLHFAITIVVLNILKKGGTYVFKNDPYEINYLTNMTTFLSKYFKTIKIQRTKIETLFSVYIICEDFFGNVTENLMDIYNEIKENNLMYPINIFDIENSEITKFIKEYYEYREDIQKNLVIKYNKYVDKLKIITLPVLKKLYHDSLLQNYYVLYKISNKYHIALNEGTIKKYEKITERNTELIMNLFIFAPLKYLTVSNNKKINLNDLILKNENLIDMTIFQNSQMYLTFHKIGIDTRDSKKWDRITREINMSQYIIDNINKTLDISRAFTKMYEILSTFKLLNLNEEVNTLHVCEAPGHFVNATYNFVKTHGKNSKHNWYANSLNPNNKENKIKYGKFPNDAYGFIKKYPNNWQWGKDNTGDITSVENILWFKNKFENKINLFTSDCGLGVNSRIDYFIQEDTMSKLNYCQILLALITLKIGGSAVFKFFIPLSKPLTISMLYILYVHFENLHFVKPVTSSPTNNEIYFVVTNKKHNLSPESLKKLISFLDEFDNNKFIVSNIDELFIKQFINIMNYFVNELVNQITIVYNFYNNPNLFEKYGKEIKETGNNLTNIWREQFDFTKTDKTYFLTN